MFIAVIPLNKNNNTTVKDKTTTNKASVGCQVTIAVHTQLFWCHDNLELKTVSSAETYYSKEKIDTWKTKIPKKMKQKAMKKPTW